MMNPDTWAQVKEVLAAALDLPEADRMAFIVERCPDIELLAEIEDLLRYQRSSHQAGVFRAMESDRDVTVDSENLLTKRLAVLDAGPTEGEVGPADRGLTADGLPYSIGAYRVVKWLGEGGMATVYLAEQQHPRRTVALKVIKAGLGGAEILRRFDQEANLLARLQHPGIAQVYEAGTAATPFGAQPFFVMEFIKGEPLDRYAATHQLTTRQRLELMCDVCDGVHHAHLRGIIHRDLKPANILVDESGQPKILDFGIAHATESDGRATQQTERGQILGTPQYMSPEQVLADPSAIDNRSDVYTIGVMLYELLAGRLPYEIGRGPLLKVAQTICQAEPTSLGSVDRRYRGDVETVIAKAMEKDPDRRYGSAADLAADLRRHLHDEPIIARPATTTYRLQKFVRRHRTLAVAAAAIFAVLIGGIAVSTWEALRARRSEDVARRALAVNQFRAGVALLGEAMPHEGVANLAAAVRLDPGNAAIRAGTIAALMRLQWPVITYQHQSDVTSATFSRDDARMVTASTDGTARIWNVRTGQAGPVLRHKASVRSAVFSSDGARVLTASEDGTARIWNATTGKPIGVPMRHAGAVMSAAFSADDMRVVTASLDSTARVWDGWTGEALGSALKHAERVLSASFSADGGRVMTGASPSSVRLWDTETRQPVATLPASPIRPRFSNDGKRVVTMSEDHAARVFDARVWDARTGHPLAVLPHPNAVQSAAFSPDGTLIVTACTDGAVRVWDVLTRQAVTTIHYPGFIGMVAFSPDGTRVLTASWDDTAQVWNARTGEPVGPPLRHSGDVVSATFSADGTYVLTASRDHTARLWDVRTREPIATPLQHSAEVLSAAFSADGALVVTTSKDRTARVWNARSGQAITPPIQHAGWVVQAAFSQDRKRVATASWDGTARIWDARTGQPVGPPMQHAGRVESVVFSQDGKRVLTRSDRTARLWDTETGKPVARPMQHKDYISSASFSPDGTHVVTVSAEDGVRIWDVARPGAWTGVPLKRGVLIRSASLSSDGARLVTSGYDDAAQIWNARTGQPVGIPMQHAEYVNANFSPDGSRVVTASGDRTARIWDASTGRAVGVPMQHAGPLASATFSPDGTRVVTASYDDTARVWDARTGYPVSAPLQHLGDVVSATFNADGTRVLTASSDGTARLWDAYAGSPSEAEIVAEAADALSGYSLNNDALSLIPLDDAPARLTALRIKVANVRSGESSALSFLHWLFENPWNRTISPQSSTMVNEYITGRLKTCNPHTQDDAESDFVGHPLFQRINDLCPTAAPQGSNSAPHSPTEPTPPSVAGTWIGALQYSINSAGTRPITLMLTQVNRIVSGSYKVPDFGHGAVSGTISGNSFSGTFVFQDDAPSIVRDRPCNGSMVVTGPVSGDTLTWTSPVVTSVTCSSMPHTLSIAVSRQRNRPLE